MSSQHFDSSSAHKTTSKGKAHDIHYSFWHQPANTLDEICPAGRRHKRGTYRATNYGAPGQAVSTKVNRGSPPAQCGRETGRAPGRAYSRDRRQSVPSEWLALGQ